MDTEPLRVVVVDDDEPVQVLVRTVLDRSGIATPALSAGAFAFYEKTVVTPALPEILAQDYALFRRALQGDDVCAPSAAERRRSSGTTAHIMGR